MPAACNEEVLNSVRNKMKNKLTGMAGGFVDSLDL
jgi:hypothetical protein